MVSFYSSSRIDAMNVIEHRCLVCKPLLAAGSTFAGVAGLITSAFGNSSKGHTCLGFLGFSSGLAFWNFCNPFRITSLPLCLLVLQFAGKNAIVYSLLW